MPTNPPRQPDPAAASAGRCCRVALLPDLSGTLAVQLGDTVRGMDIADGQRLALVDDGNAPDLLLGFVDVGDFDAALAEVRVQIDAHPACSLLAVTRGLSARQLAALQAAGVADFVRTPVSPDELRARIDRLVAPLAQPLDAAHPALRDLLGASPAFQRVMQQLPQVARYDVATLLLGETGTGKEAFAQAIHYLSARARGPWVAVNCAAIPIELLEAELFGHVKGAYTHASASRCGLIHEAEGGTLFLDEIDSLPYGAQAKLLRFLQDRRYRAVGSNREVTADVRVVAASNRELDRLVAAGAFRQDLMFRLNLLQLQLPPLRERVEDVTLLAEHFLAASARTWQLPPQRLAPAALRKLQAHAWPGNVRELKNVVERAALMSGAGPVIDADAFDLLGTDDDATEAADESFGAAKARVVASFERNYLRQVLAASGGNIAQAARAAKKNRRAFFELMRKHKIEPQDFRGALQDELA